ncbi:BQ5605_C010g05925 [Microbotryum silenes-dioicae]|uniref:BQ5605_C010g05925 protein n=1 Tax=Microbotryum silenes-dioicae TaxID=796604 RepID=A0A2X0NSX9_9BASI|nr:BQ5605_C010g05925 [Microbotryum silenes-dioicae]
MADPSNTTDDLFAGMKKKKKSSKKVNFDELELDAPTASAAPVEEPAAAAVPSPVVDNEPTPAPAADVADAGELDFSDLKKKKKKKSVRIASDDEDDAPTASGPTARKVDALGNEIIEEPTAEEAAATSSSAVSGGDGLDEFADLKKKKKKGTKKANFDLEAFEKELAETEAAEEVAPAPKKSILKDSSKTSTPLGSDGEEIDGDDDDDEPVPEGDDPFGAGEGGDDAPQSKAEAAAVAKAWLKEDRDYTYTELLGRFYQLLYASHPSLSGAAGKKKYTIPPPQLFREGNKRSIFANVADICKRMHRQPEHVIQFLFAELGTNGSVDGAGRLVIKGRFQQKQIENVLRRYILEYVTCKTCKSPDTVLTKRERLFFIKCESCNSERSVQSIKTGFVAQTGKQRRAMRAAA